MELAEVDSLLLPGLAAGGGPIVVYQVVDLLMTVLEVPQIETILVCSQEVLAVTAHRKRMDILLLTSLVGSHMLTLFRLIHKSGLGHAEAFALEELLLGRLVLVHQVVLDSEELDLS